MAMIVPPIDESAPIRREAQGLVGVFRAMARTAETLLINQDFLVQNISLKESVLILIEILDF